MHSGFKGSGTIPSPSSLSNIVSKSLDPNPPLSPPLLRDEASFVPVRTPSPSKLATPKPVHNSTSPGCSIGAISPPPEVIKQASVGNLSLVDEPRKHPCCGRQLDPSLNGYKSGDFSSNLHHAGWGYNSCTGGAVDEVDADAASVCCWLYGVFFITIDNAADVARTNVMQEGLLNFVFY
ncbi:hypothetical protein Nepgr_007867 [Nepenthes gracilis]|uniref:Uncharacterized protein n=1 Tax=Nepenthes gracilis TaxID=150966 RepID=A0AAD3XIN5_NEPGR|nr:hypothetical protein Nepgr_007867 [Nepenthes gracilis]